jgi:hypothetical protein
VLTGGVRRRGSWRPSGRRPSPIGAGRPPSLVNPTFTSQERRRHRPCPTGPARGQPLRRRRRSPHRGWWRNRCGAPGPAPARSPRRCRWWCPCGADIRRPCGPPPGQGRRPRSLCRRWSSAWAGAASPGGWPASFPRGRGCPAWSAAGAPCSWPHRVGGRCRTADSRVEAGDKMGVAGGCCEQAFACWGWSRELIGPARAWCSGWTRLGSLHD